MGADVDHLLVLGSGKRKRKSKVGVCVGVQGRREEARTGTRKGKERICTYVTVRFSQGIEDARRADMGAIWSFRRRVLS